ncbi:acetyl-CoA carboxylase biotin carboxylase subunit family protein [Alicyclobacillus sp. SO9]|uniref:ATP-grasp domain-containing protein n=1 Tax=Alicyclobacillus sp. SO9 TaxID=2665646 RepID=UPI0018E75793|nr:ATP-grasp domain-containing protein [Alicyclobacillus sp. SO9]QQE79730.1 ATP-grasp domain-containing protein [Alicyclobacillus sp. SO9]
MSILILNSASRDRCPYDEWLQHLNEDLILLTTRKHYGEFVGGSYKRVIGFDNYRDNWCVELTAMELAETNDVRAIIASGEFDLLRAAKLRDMLNISGQNWESALAFRDKTVMKHLTMKAGIKVPQFERINDAFDISSFISENGYPVVIKPISGAGSLDTKIINNRIDLENMLSSAIKTPMEIEEFIEGDMYHVDGIVMDGRVTFAYPSKYINGCLAHQKNLYLGSYMLDATNPLFESLLGFVEQVVFALPTPQYTIFHAEVFHTPNNEFVLCEIASRVGGGLIEESFLHAFGINLQKTMAEFQCGIYDVLATSSNKSPKFFTGFILIPPHPLVLSKLANDDPPDYVLEKHISGEIGRAYRAVDSVTNSIASILVRGDSENQVLRRIEKVNDWFQKCVQWDESVDE